jgi:hypothetical protein
MQEVDEGDKVDDAYGPQCRPRGKKNKEKRKKKSDECRLFT